MIATAAPVGWWAWLARSLPQDAEAGGGLMVAVIQLAISAGAIVGGFLYDASGYRMTFPGKRRFAPRRVSAGVQIIENILVKQFGMRAFQ